MLVSAGFGCVQLFQVGKKRWNSCVDRSLRNAQCKLNLVAAYILMKKKQLEAFKLTSLALLCGAAPGGDCGGRG